MNDWIGSLGFSLFGGVLLLCVIGLWFTVTIPSISSWRKRFFIIYFLIFMICDLLSIAETAFQTYIVPHAVFYLLLVCEDFLLSLPPLMVTLYLLHCCSEDMHTCKLLHAALCLWILSLVLVISFPFIGGFIYFTPDNHYYRGPLYPLLPIPTIVILLLNFIGTMRRRALLSRKTFLSFVIAEVPMTIALTLQMFDNVLYLVNISYVISALAMLSFMLSDQIEQILLQQEEILRQEREISRQQLEIANERINVMVLQMRPHFIYNTLISIYSLCEFDPMKARQVTIDFTNYLRKNFNAITSTSPITFSAELEHTRAYLAVEQAQFDDMLLVDYDIQFTRFRLPPLTLQPIVENSVKHGMNPYSGPLHISIGTRLSDSAAEIIVEDNGPGFDFHDESKPHTTLTNIRQRLEMMCGGSMIIKSKTGQGTVVIITVPPQ